MSEEQDPSHLTAFASLNGGTEYRAFRSIRRPESEGKLLRLNPLLAQSALARIFSVIPEEAYRHVVDQENEVMGGVEYVEPAIAPTFRHLAKAVAREE